MNFKDTASPMAGVAPKPHVLAVEDEPVNRRLIRAILERNGYAVRTAASAEEALGALADEIPSLLILDVLLPGLSGYELCKKIKEDPRMQKIPVIFLTGRNSPSDYREGTKLGAAMYVAKPVNEKNLLVMTRMFLAPAVEGASQGAA